MDGSPVGRWLAGDRSDRDRYEDMHRRFRDAPLFGLAVGGACTIAAFTYGWWLLALVALASATMVGGLRLHPRVRHPELLGAATFLLLELNLAASVLLSGGAASPLLGLMLVPVFTQAVCFRPRVTLAWVALSSVVAVAVIQVARWLPPAPPAPAHLQTASFLAVLGALALAAHHLATADVKSRDDAVLDPLTGLFNRAALHAHLTDAHARARAADDHVAVVMCDIDRFKDVNDTHGHDQGDAVLRQLADRLLRSVRTSDLVYRLGGEEFMVLMPGHGPDAAVAAADRLRRDVEGAPLAGLSITVSVGVTTARGRAIDFDAMVKQADAALYRAKRDGRNRVRAAVTAGV